MQCFGDLIAMEGTNANEPCRIGSIRPRRQARERRSLQPSKSQVPSGKNNGFNASVQCVCRLCGTNSRQPVHHICSKINVFAACAEPTPDNQYTTFKPTHELVHAAMRNHLLMNSVALTTGKILLCFHILNTSKVRHIDPYSQKV